jgi:hypothetical protein
LWESLLKSQFWLGFILAVVGYIQANCIQEKSPSFSAKGFSKFQKWGE